MSFFNNGKKSSVIEPAATAFEAVVRKAEASGPLDARKQAVVTAAQKEFVALRQQESADPDSADFESKAWDVARQRVYLLAREAIGFEARSLIRDLRDWEVPAENVGELAGIVATIPAEIDDQSDSKARAALMHVYEDYDYWSDYVDWYVVTMRVAAAVLVALILIGLGVCWWQLTSGNPMLGFLAGSLGGASLSVLLKRPPLSPYGQIAGFWARAAARLASGVTVSFIGFSLLGSGLITLGVQSGDKLVTPAELIKACGATCPSTSLLFLAGVGVLFGFSERALSSVEETVFGKLAPKSTSGS